MHGRHKISESSPISLSAVRTYNAADPNAMYDVQRVLLSSGSSGSFQVCENAHRNSLPLMQFLPACLCIPPQCQGRLGQTFSKWRSRFARRHHSYRPIPGSSSTPKLPRDIFDRYFCGIHRVTGLNVSIHTCTTVLKELCRIWVCNGSAPNAADVPQV